MFGRLVWPAVLTTLKHLNLKKTMLAFCCSGHRIISQIMSRDFAAQVFFLQTVSMELGGNFRQTPPCWDLLLNQKSHQIPIYLSGVSMTIYFEGCHDS